MLSTLTRRQLNLAGFAACAALLAFAFYAEYGLKLLPCNMCMLQRIVVVKLGLLLLLAGLHDPGERGAKIYGVLIGLQGLAGVALAARHVWMQLQPPGSLPSCGADFATLVAMLPPWEVVLKIVRGGGDCQAITWTFLGVSMPAWLLIAFVALTLAAVIGNFRLERATRPTR